MNPRGRQLRARELIESGSENWSYPEFREYWAIYAEDHQESKTAILCILKRLKRFKIITQTNLL